MMKDVPEYHREEISNRLQAFLMYFLVLDFMVKRELLMKKMSIFFFEI